jgi:Rps23 Pro-64 3,4-dihydroxylase Tpa1-like proline 4-hydroxylase
VLPVFSNFDLKNMEHIINEQYLQADFLAQLHEGYVNGQPCKHVVMDNFLRPEVAEQLYQNFPKLDTLNVKRKSLNEKKSEDYHFERFHPIFQEVKDTIISDDFCHQIMGKIAGLEDLFVTTDNTGAGVHQGGDGSYVDIHIDFNMSTKFNAWRRLNLLVYLNKNWKDEYGGALELWDKDMKSCEKMVYPYFNRAVLFYTDENAPHGYRKMSLPEGETRKSFYAYYYTQVEEGMTFRDSTFIARPDETFVKRTLTGVKETLKVTVKSALYKMGFKSLDFQDKNK